MDNRTLPRHLKRRYRRSRLRLSRYLSYRDANVLQYLWIPSRNIFCLSTKATGLSADQVTVPRATHLSGSWSALVCDQQYSRHCLHQFPTFLLSLLPANITLSSLHTARCCSDSLSCSRTQGMSSRGFKSSSQPIFSSSSGLSPLISKQDEPSHFLPNANGNLTFSNPFSVSPRASPGLSEQRSQELGINNSGIGSQSLNVTGDGHGQGQVPRFSAPVFRPSFPEDAQMPIHALDPIAPDQREPNTPNVANNPVFPISSSGTSPSFRILEGERSYPQLEGHANARERSITGLIVDSPDNSLGTSTSNPLPPSGIFRQASLGGGISSFSSLQRQNSFPSHLTPRHSQDNSIPSNNNNYVSSALSGPPVTHNTAPAPPLVHDPVLASSPVSSVSAPSASSALVSAVGGGGGGAQERNQNFDSYIKTSPFLRDILDRVIRTEYAQRDLSRELGLLSNNISKRLDALTNSVQQILMIQQHNHNNSGNSGSHHHPPFHGNGPVSPADGGFDGMPPNMNVGNGSGLMGGPPNRPHSRNPPPPVRTWSAGSLDMPMRQDTHLSRPDGLLNQKRRSIVGNLNRRDSAVVGTFHYSKNMA